MRKEIKTLVAVGILFIGIGVCVAGLLWPPLYPTGAIIITAALGMIATTMSAKTPTNTPETSNLHGEVITTIPERAHIETQLNLFFTYKERSKREIALPSEIERPKRPLNLV